MPTERDGATARPWRCERYGLSYAVVHEGGRVAYAYAVSDGKAVEEAKANAELIVTAVNGHDALIEKLRALAAEFNRRADADPKEGMKLSDSRRQGQHELMMAGQALAYATAATELLRALGDGR